MHPIAIEMNMKRGSTRRHTRRGTIYAIVLLSSLLVATIGVSALQLVRLQSRMASDYSDFIAARAYARAGIDIGMLTIRNDPNWRVNLGNGNWATNKTIDTGTYSLSAVDPIDNDVTQGDNHPVILTSSGMKGNAAFKIAARLEVGPRVGSCLEVSMTSGGDTSVNAATLTSDQTVSANGVFGANSATVNADVEAYGSISGSTYAKTTVQRTIARDMPDPAHALDYYLANGTTIPYTALQQWTAGQLVNNGGFESNISDWYASTNCVLQRYFLRAQSGWYSLKVKSRQRASDVAAMDLPLSSVTSGNTYHLSMPVYPTANGTAYGVLTIESTGDGVQTFTTPTFTLAKNSSGVYTWVDLNGDVKPTWTGDLIKATLSPSFSVKNDYYTDEVSFVDVTYPAGSYVIDSQLLSPTVNPYGATNPEGIYIIDCGGTDVFVGRSRIVGTLVFLNPGSNSAIGNAVNMAAAVYNYPALLTNKPLNINLDSSAVSEAAIGRNLNPAGTPFPFSGGASNDTLTDSYPSKISGLIYSSDQLMIANAPSITGVVIANGNISVAATSLNLSYANTYLNNPPPGFDIGTITMKVLPGTWARSVN